MSCAAARELKLSANPVDAGIVALKPVKPEDDWVRDGDNGESNVLGVRRHVERSDDVMGDKAGQDQAIVNCRDRNRDVQSSTLKGVT
jgi:hypothetical protein